MSSDHYKKRVEELLVIHGEIRERVEARLCEFRRIGESGDDRLLFVELVFCLLTPQSGARRCGRALDNLQASGLLLEGGFDEISRELNIVRFRNNKARYIIEARESFMSGDISIVKVLLSHGGDTRGMRRWIAGNVKGIGYKEASHFLRNIGKGEDLAILDRHVLRNMHLLGMIGEIPASISPSRYHELEDILEEFASGISIPLDHLDFVLWYRETGDIYK